MFLIMRNVLVYVEGIMEWQPSWKSNMAARKYEILRGFSSMSAWMIIHICLEFIWTRINNPVKFRFISSDFHLYINILAILKFQNGRKSFTYHVQGGPKNWHNFLYALILTNFQNSFTVRIRRKFVITLSLKIPPHLNCVATLPCVLWKHHDAAFFLQGQDLLFKTFYLLVHLM